MGSYLLPDTLTAQQQCDVLETVLLGLLEDVPLGVRQRLWFHMMELQCTMGTMTSSG
jgi:hypothetical protein